MRLGLENRSFDHLLGFLYADSGNLSPTGATFEGLTGQESNPDASGQAVAVFKINPTDPGAYFMPGADPGEGYANTNSQLFGSGTHRGHRHDRREHHGRVHSRGAPGAVRPGPRLCRLRPPVQLGAYRDLPEPGLRLRGHQPGPYERRHRLPHGAEHLRPDDGAQPDLEDLRLRRGAIDRKNFPDTTTAPDANFGKFADFTADAAAGRPPRYCFLEPSRGSSGNSQHPNYDVSLGEKLIHDVYYALRSGPAWAQTLLIISCNEHGGCYDHVPPPAGAVPPDGSPGEFGFDFTRFGVRVPAVLVSPLIPAAAPAPGPAVVPGLANCTL